MHGATADLSGRQNAQAALGEMSVEGEGLTAAVTLDQREGGGVDIAPELVAMLLEDCPGVVLEAVLDADQLDRLAGSEAPPPLDRLLPPDPHQQCRVGLGE